MKNNNGLLYHFFYLLLTKSSVKHVISYISKTLKPNQTKPNQTKPNCIFLAFCSAKSSITFSKFKCKISSRAFYGITLRIFKNY